MALNPTNGKAIINALADGKAYTFPSPYIGLLTKMPAENGTGGAEPTYPEYCRVSLTALGIEGKVILGEASSETETGDDAGKMVSYVKNQERIYWPDVETVDSDYEETVIGIALYSSLAVTTPYLWEALPEGSEVVIKLKSVPMIKINNLKLTAK